MGAPFRQREMDRMVMLQTISQFHKPTRAFGAPCHLCIRRCAPVCAVADHDAALDAGKRAAAHAEGCHHSGSAREVR